MPPSVGQIGNASEPSFSESASGQPDAQNPVLEAALYYASVGWKVFHVHGLTADGQCTCGRVHKKERGKGKHPVLDGGFKNGTTDPALIRSWFCAGVYNIAIATGPQSDLLVIDIDGPEGEEHLRKLEERYGKLPMTRKHLTGRGYHLLFHYPADSGIGIWSRKDLGIDCRGADGYVVAPPSRHFSGSTYTCEDDTVPVAEAPVWLIEYCQTNGESYLLRMGATAQDGDFSFNRNVPPYLRDMEQKLGTFDIGVTKAPPAWSADAEAELRDALSKIPASGNENWFDVACALKWLSGSWGEDSCRKILDDWSASKPEEHDPVNNQTRWNSLSPKHSNPTTTGTLFKLAKNYGWAQASGSSLLSGDGDQSVTRYDKEGKEDEVNQKTKLILIALQAELWQDADGNAYATVPVGEHFENYAIKSKGFRRWLVGTYGDQNMLRVGNHQVPSAPSAQSLSEAIAAIEARCMRGTIYKPAVRIGEAGGRIYLDLGTPDWRVVEIDASGWRVVQSAPVKFIRPSGMRSLPIPVAGGKIVELRPFLNVTDDDFTLIVAYLVMAFKSSGPYPILCINAEHGAGKTTATRIIRGLIDPNVADIRPAPREEQDLIIAANNGWVLAFDNVSHISEKLADAMCRVSTGTGFGTRTLFTDTDETLVRVCRPQIVNGIPDLATRADFADRAVITSFSSIPDHQRKKEAELWVKFEEAHPRILGALLDGVSCALRRQHNVKLEKTPRMADFAQWVEAAAPAFGWGQGDFLKIYLRNRNDIIETTLDADEVASAIVHFAAREAKDKEWKGTMTDLYGKLMAPTNSRYWPKSAASLSNRIKRIMPAMRTIGIDLEIGERSAGQRTVAIRKRA